MKTHPIHLLYAIEKKHIHFLHEIKTNFSLCSIKIQFDDTPFIEDYNAALSKHSVFHYLAEITCCERWYVVLYFLLFENAMTCSISICTPTTNIWTQLLIYSRNVPLKTKFCFEVLCKNSIFLYMNHNIVL